MADRPEVITLCGSTRFVDRMAVVGWTMEKGGAIVLGLHLLPSWYTDQRDHQAEFENVKEEMDELHLRKIDMSDRVVVCNFDGYIGESTRREIAYAQSAGKQITFMEDAD